jgi:hypothetical protein
MVSGFTGNYPLRPVVTTNLWICSLIAKLNQDYYIPSKQHALDLEQRLGVTQDSNPDFNSLSRLEMFAMASVSFLTFDY